LLQALFLFFVCSLIYFFFFSLISKELASKNKTLTADQQSLLEVCRSQFESLPVWPAYAELHQFHQYDELNLDVVRAMTSAILEDKVELEKHIAKLYEENDPASIDVRHIEEQREAIKAKINNMVSITLLKFPDPEYLLKFAEDMQNKDEAEIVLRVGERCLDKIQEIEGFLKQRVPLLRLIERLNQKKLAKKNAFPKDKAEQLAKLQATFDSLTALPHFVSGDKTQQYANTKISIAKLIVKTSVAGLRSL